MTYAACIRLPVSIRYQVLKYQGLRNHVLSFSHFYSLQSQQKRNSLAVNIVTILHLSELMRVGKLLKDSNLVMSTAGKISFLLKP